MDEYYLETNPKVGEWHNMGEIVKPLPPPPPGALPPFPKAEQFNAWWCGKFWACHCHYVSSQENYCWHADPAVHPPTSIDWVVDWTLVPAPACVAGGGGGGGM